MSPRVLSCVLGAVLAAAACVDVSNDHFLITSGAGGSGGQGGQGGQGGDTLSLDSGSGGPPAADASGYCGNQVHALTLQPLTVYFIFDISGSMSTPVSGGTRYSLVQGAAVSLVNDLRYVIKAGAAAFPLQSSENPCAPGGEIFPPALDAPQAFNQATAPLVPYGGTPTAATLLALAPKLAALPGKVIAVLSTDGGPNCNASAMCTLAECTENIEGCAPGDTCCADAVNCCAPGGPAGPLNCVDEAATVQAVSAVAATGVKVYIVGIPGSQVYADVLTSMAFAGKAEAPSTPFYYDVQDLSTLTSVFKTIAGAEVPCDITVDDPPSMQGDTNVYLDQTIVLYDPVNGWTWSAPNVVTLHGAACAELQSGAVSQVQVVSGCPTQATQ
jgi:hypothetical protein